MLSTLSASVSTYFSKSTPPVSTPEEDEASRHGERENAQAIAPHSPVLESEYDSPHTPEQHPSVRYSPNSLSQSGNQTMASVLSAHPRFSVFRKSTSSQSLDQLARKGEAEDDDARGAEEDASPAPSGLASMRHRRSFSVRDLCNDDGDLVETLLTPPNHSPIPRPARSSDSPTTRIIRQNGSGSSSSETSFHLDSAELPSLNFGDHSSSASSSRGSSPVASPSAATTAVGAIGSTATASLPGTPVRTNAHANASSFMAGQTSGIRLVPDSPPSTTSRTQTPIRRRDANAVVLRSSTNLETAAAAAAASPPAHSASSSSTRSASGETAASTRMRSSTTASAKGPIERVQFSPLGLCPSPLLTAPMLPPPPPPPPALPISVPGLVSTPPPSSYPIESPSEHAAAAAGAGALVAQHSQSLHRKGSNGILKAPKTPGTGRSVRFSSSTVQRTVERWMTPPEDDGSSGSFGDGDGERDRSQQEAVRDFSPCQLADPSEEVTASASAPAAEVSALVNFSSASFLSKLQAVIPSPDCSLETTSPPPPVPVELPAGAEACDNNSEEEESTPETRIAAAVAADDSAGENVAALDAAEQVPPIEYVTLSQKRPRARLSLLDESNPFLSLQLSTMTTIDGATDDNVSVAGSTEESRAAGPFDATATTSERSEISAATISGTTISAGAADGGGDATLLMQASLMRGSVLYGGGGPSFGGQSFVEVSHLNGPPSRSAAAAGRAAQQITELGAVEEIVEHEETTPTDYDDHQGATSDDQTLGKGDSPVPTTTSIDLAPAPAPASVPAPRMSGLPTSAGTPSRPSPWSLPNTTPRRPSPLTQEAEFSFTSSNTSTSAAELAALTTATTSPLHESDLSRTSASPMSAIADTILDESAGSLVEIRPIDPSPPPAYQAAPAAPTSNATQDPPPNASTSAPSSSSAASSSSSFYRQFMAARAREGLSQSAKEEWERLERGEKASPKENRGFVDALAEADDSIRREEEKSVYWLPQKAETTFDNGDDEGKSVYVDAESAESSLVEIDEVRTAFLSPIAELTEPESDANTSLEKAAEQRNRSSRSRHEPQASSSSRATLPSVPGTPGRSGISLPPATPRSASKIPRPRNPITPSQNPFLLQLARQAADSKAGSLLHDLFSTQEDQLAASASQRFLLSSLVTNLQDEVEQKNAVVANLKRQVEQARAEAREIEQLAVAWERRAQTGASAQTRSPAEAKKLAALEETVRLLADELETRMREDRSRRRKLEKELERTRADLVHAVNEHREVAIRFKHVNAANTQSDEDRAAAQAAHAEEEARRREAERERDELRTRWRIDADERDRVVALLREEVASLRSSAPTPRTDEHLEREVQRRVELATQASTREVQLAQHELMQRDAALDELRRELQASRDEAARLTRSVQEERQHAELASADLEGLLAAKEHELAELAQSRSDAQEELDDALTRLDAAESERDRLAETLSSKEAEFAQQTEQTRAALAAMAELESAVARVERDLANKEGELEQVRSDLANQQRESDSVLEKRDRVLAEAEREAGRLRKDLEATRGENARFSELVGKLRLDSADREVKVAKLKKRTAELEEDVFGLNIALDAKQQEASHWKRQMSQLKLEKDRQAAEGNGAVLSTVVRNTLAAIVPSSSATTTTTTAKKAGGPRRKSHATTPFPSEKVRPRRNMDPHSAAAPPNSTANDSESHDLTLPPLHDGNEETPSRPAVTSRPIRRSTSASSAVSVGLGLPRAVSDKARSRPSSTESKENEAPPTRRREAMLA
ncbi:hypothetical protein RHOSPDRAFT_34630 [Rhodotorula sp. JG-1b]|nr:hypothetical protein RHOSPDRAFT_34630 [Rhodotorula sp. JG-1b]